ncbi:hypothetical protein D3C78_1028020 [compost metagenome]
MLKVEVVLKFVPPPAARGSSGIQVGNRLLGSDHRRNLFRILTFLVAVPCADADQSQGRQAGHVAEVRRVGVVVGQDCQRERLNFGEPGGPNAERLPCEYCRLDARADRTVGNFRA